MLDRGAREYFVWFQWEMISVFNCCIYNCHITNGAYYDVLKHSVYQDAFLPWTQITFLTFQKKKIALHTVSKKKKRLYVHLHWDPPKGPLKKKRSHPLQKILTDWIFVDTSCYWKQYLSCKMSHSGQLWNKNPMFNSASVTQRCICKKTNKQKKYVKVVRSIVPVAAVTM